jgi:5-methylcytosine-specific restriction endonuclease McrA
VGAAYKAKRREYLAARQQNICPYCGGKFTEKRPATTEHVVPRSKGGVNTLLNVIAVHESCNGKRNSAPIPEHIRPRVREIILGNIAYLLTLSSRPRVLQGVLL